MYIYTCIRNKNCHQQSYGFQNLMSSWGLGNIIFEITIFTWVFKFLVPKVDGYQSQKKFVNDFWKFQKPFSIWGTYNVPEGPSANPYGEARRAEFDGTGGRSSKVSFKILHTLWVFRTCIYILVYEIKIVTNILMGFKIWCQVGGGGVQFLKLPYVCDFSNIWF